VKVGDIVRPREEYVIPTEGQRYGVLLDWYEDDTGLIYFEVQWERDREWWSPFELELVSESR